jgi:adenylate cyclase class 2
MRIVKQIYEAKFLRVDVADLQAKLVALGAIQTFPRTLLTRRIFESDIRRQTTWVYLRDLGARSTLAMKHVVGRDGIDGVVEIETEVLDSHAMTEILCNLGMREVRYQENYRDEWRLGTVIFDFDTWPNLPTFLEIVGQDEASVRNATTLLELDYLEDEYGSVDLIYARDAGRAILAEPTVLFANAEHEPPMSTTTLFVEPIAEVARIRPAPPREAPGG